MNRYKIEISGQLASRDAGFSVLGGIVYCFKLEISSQLASAGF